MSVKIHNLKCKIKKDAPLQKHLFQSIKNLNKFNLNQTEFPKRRYFA